jgi:hypothetical protein
MSVLVRLPRQPQRFERFGVIPEGLLVEDPSLRTV